MNVRDALRAVPWLSALDERALDSLAEQADRLTFAPGEQMLAELEVGESLYILTEGEARVTVTAAGGERRELGTLKAGDACGEISLLSGELHTATVIAHGPVSALRLDRQSFDDLVSRYPPVLNPLAHVLARRIVDTDAALDAVLTDAGSGAHPEDALAGRSSAVVSSEPTLRRAWRELVVSHRRELPFYALTSFILTLLCVRSVAFALERAGVPLLDFLRAAYTAGIALVFVSTGTALLRFRLGVQRAVALVYGVGFALILNELSVFLAFDTFYLDMTTRDPKLMFSVETLYRRSESSWGVFLMVAFLAQLTFLRPFYRRAAFVLGSRLRALVTGTPRRQNSG